MKLTNVEIQMFNRGYVSARMIAAKTGYSRATATRFVREHPKAVSLDDDPGHTGRGGFHPQKFVPVGAVAKWVEKRADVLDIDMRDWNDVTEET